MFYNDVFSFLTKLFFEKVKVILINLIYVNVDQKLNTGSVSQEITFRFCRDYSRKS